MRKLMTILAALLVCGVAFAAQDVTLDQSGGDREVRDPKLLKVWLEANAADAETRMSALEGTSTGDKVFNGNLTVNTNLTAGGVLNVGGVARFVGAVSNAALTASQLVVTDANKQLSSSATVPANMVTEASLKAVDSSTDEDVLTYEATTGDFEWHSAAELKAAWDLEIGTDVQAYDADLTTWAGVSSSANGRSLVSATDYAAMKALLDLEIGTDIPAKGISGTWTPGTNGTVTFTDGVVTTFADGTP